MHLSWLNLSVRIDWMMYDWAAATRLCVAGMHQCSDAFMAWAQFDKSRHRTT